MARAISVYPAVISPLALSAAAIYFAAAESWYFAAAVPFVWIASVCAQPNLNLADGLLAYLSIVVGLIVMAFHQPLGEALVAGTLAGYVLSVIEKTARMRPAPDA